ncbi:hypothetical protein MTR67_025693 [Solanum verrucosum]|uniref:Uncharacterized protein n=1 Tax=Solanum verrucosum TaxID=315347 RepID=A0AAF0R090_SOLVR|nr:hypothetical protein MTR67_025693 [Solanum verrucosum]
MESTELQILHSGEIEVDPTLLNYTVIAITENKNGYESGDNDMELQQILFYAAQFHLGKNLESSPNHGVAIKPVEIEYSVIPNSLNLKKNIDSIMPVDFLMRVRYVIRLTKVLASAIVIDRPFMDCMVTLVDDLREYPIRGNSRGFHRWKNPWMNKLSCLGYKALTKLGRLEEFDLA